MKIHITVLAAVLAFGAPLFQPEHAIAQAAKPSSIVNLMDFRNQLLRLQNNISATVGSLNTVKECKSEADLPKAVSELGTNFRSLEARVEEVRTNATIVKACVKANFESWAKELTAMQSANLREKAQDRLSRSQKEFEKIVVVAGEAKEQVLPFVSDIKDIVIYLNADTSQEAVKSLSGNIWKLGNRSKSVFGSIGDVIKQIDNTVKSLPQK